MSRSPELYLRDIIEAHERIRTYLKDTDKSEFIEDAMLADSILFNLITIGEAVKSISDEEKGKYPDVRWRDIARFRDRLVHHYFKTDLDIVWEIVTEHLPTLVKYVEIMLDDIESENPS